MSIQQTFPYKFDKMVMQFNRKHISLRYVFDDKNRNATFT